MPFFSLRLFSSSYSICSPSIFLFSLPPSSQLLQYPLFPYMSSSFSSSISTSSSIFFHFSLPPSPQLLQCLLFSSMSPFFSSSISPSPSVFLYLLLLLLLLSSCSVFSSPLCLLSSPLVFVHLLQSVFFLLILASSLPSTVSTFPLLPLLVFLIQSLNVLLLSSLFCCSHLCPLVLLLPLAFLSHPPPAFPCSFYTSTTFFLHFTTLSPSSPTLLKIHGLIWV